MPLSPELHPVQSPAWVVQSWVSFIVSVSATALGIYSLPLDLWVRGFMGMGLLFVVGSTLTLAKTVRDQHESTRMVRRIDDARVTKLIAEHDPLKAAM